MPTLAAKALRTSLPAGCCRNAGYQVELTEHPLDPYFRELRDRRRKELQRCVPPGGIWDFFKKKWQRCAGGGAGALLAAATAPQLAKYPETLNLQAL